MEKSTIYIKCPKCGENGLLTEMQGQYFCANCMFNYMELKENPDKLDDVLIENIKMKGFGPIFASALYQRITLTQPMKANEYIRQLAAKNNIDLFEHNSIFAKISLWIAKLIIRKRH